MKTCKWLLVASLALNALLVLGGGAYVARRTAARAAAAEPPATRSPGYLGRLAAYQALPERPGAVVLAGDSLTDGGEWDELLRTETLNRGIIFDTAEGLRYRLPEILRHTPRKLFVMAGINDLAREGKKAEEVLAAHRAIAETVALVSPGTTLYLQSVLPMNAAVWRWPLPEGLGAERRKVNDGLRAMADGKKAVFLDVAARLTDADGALDRRYTSDGLHLNGAGYRVWADAILPLAGADGP